MNETLNDTTNLSPELKDAITDLQEFVGIHGFTKVILDLIDLAVQDVTLPPHQPKPLRHYSPEEQVFFQDIFNATKAEISKRINQVEEKNKDYRLPEIKLNYCNPQRSDERQRIREARDAYHLFLHNWGDQIGFVEEFNVLLLDRASAVLGIFHAFKGGTTQMLVDAKVIFGAALKANAQALVLAHNHPSLRLSPSDADIKLTKDLVQAGKVLDIQVLDHLIVTKEGYYSFAEEGVLG